ncbi:MAG: SUMF1/EgtB/PvdO family nonheme iron enzyme, partial [Nannocystaceae bacterium]|nr:SUMF1/EgtB/PvdO family nonheme iron enzyme [Nannocystaceae bacterium]
PNEGLLEEVWTDRCPAGMVIVESDGVGADHCIDRYEASVVVLDDDGDVVSSWSPYHNPGETRVAAVSLRGAVPHGYITLTTATAACEESGKYLCSESEWVRACRGPGFTVFPYGNKYRPGVCNDNRPVRPAVEYFGTEEAWVLGELDHPCLSQLPHSLRVTGQNSDCASEWGVMDMMGNLAEWTAGGAGAARGGGYVIGAGAGCYYKAPPKSAATPPYITGFRCCAQPL